MTNPPTDTGHERSVAKADFKIIRAIRVIQAVVVATLIFVILTAILAIAQYYKSPPSSASLEGRPECPHDRDTVWIAGKYTSVPEFHDCQRLIVKKGSGLEYGALAAVFLGENVIEGKASVTFTFSPAVSVKILPSGFSVPGVAFSPSIDAVILTTSGGGTTTVQTTAVATPWVEVVSEGAYPSLGIGVGFNCMFVVEHKNTAGAVVKTDAKMVNIGPVEQPCTNVASITGTPLGLFPNPIAAPPGVAVPAATRWVWSPSDSTQLIGIPCGATSCEVGPHVGPATLGSAYPKAIKGWYDEQYLADYTSGTGLTVSSVMGTVFPEPGLDTRDSAYYSGTFKDVAHVAMSSALAKYENRYAFGNAAATGPTSSMATVALCYGDRDKCIPTGVPPALVCGIAPQMPNLPAERATLHPWWARVTSPDGSKVNYFCTGYRGLPADFKMPGVVRWRWRAADETIWIPCAQGCCEVDVDLK